MKNKKPTSKILSAEERRRVWELHVNQNQNGLQLAKTFGVSKSAIYRILDGFKKDPPRLDLQFQFRRRSSPANSRKTL